MMKMNTDDLLKWVPSVLIENALKDFEVCRNAPSRFVLDMGVYHFRGEEGMCHVCLAGAFLAISMEIPDQVSFSGNLSVLEFGFGPILTKFTLALNSFRSGRIHDGITYFYLGRIVPVELRDTDQYRDLPFVDLSFGDRDKIIENSLKNARICLEFLKSKGF